MRRHLTEQQIIEACVGDIADTDQAGEHLQTCAECQSRHGELAALLAEASRSADAEAEAAFGPDRLARQREQILERVSLASRVGRVINFPSAQARPSLPAGPTGSRWVAAAAAAGLVIGLLGGHLSHDLEVEGPGIRSASSVPLAPAASRRSAEDELLGQVEVALEETGPSALRPLDALTPVAWDVRD